MTFDRVEDAIEDIRQGKLVIVADDEDRENEGDLVCAASEITPETINFMTKYGRGLICVALTNERADELGLSLMTDNNTDPQRTAFTVSVDADLRRDEPAHDGVGFDLDAAACEDEIRVLGAAAHDFARLGHDERTDDDVPRADVAVAHNDVAGNVFVYFAVPGRGDASHDKSLDAARSRFDHEGTAFGHVAKHANMAAFVGVHGASEGAVDAHEHVDLARGRGCDVFGTYHVKPRFDGGQARGVAEFSLALAQVVDVRFEQAQHAVEDAVVPGVVREIVGRAQEIEFVAVEFVLVVGEYHVDQIAQHPLLPPSLGRRIVRHYHPPPSFDDRGQIVPLGGAFARIGIGSVPGPAQCGVLQRHTGEPRIIERNGMFDKSYQHKPDTSQKIKPTKSVTYKENNRDGPYCFSSRME